MAKLKSQAVWANCLNLLHNTGRGKHFEENFTACQENSKRREKDGTREEGAPLIPPTRRSLENMLEFKDLWSARFPLFVRCNFAELRAGDFLWEWCNWCWLPLSQSHFDTTGDIPWVLPDCHNRYLWAWGQQKTLDEQYYSMSEKKSDGTLPIYKNQTKHLYTTAEKTWALLFISSK